MSEDHGHSHEGQPIDDLMQPSATDPFFLPPERHGWRGIGVPGHRKRKWWTVLHNDQALVTALLLIPGERSVRHSHETGELSIHYEGEMRPVVLWHPPGELHPVIPAEGGTQMTDEVAAAAEEARRATQDSAMAELLSRLLVEQRQMRAQLERLARGQPSPSIIVDVLFPPFKTTIDDPAYPEKRTIVGQWYD